MLQALGVAAVLLRKGVDAFLEPLLAATSS